METPTILKYGRTSYSCTNVFKDNQSGPSKEEYTKKWKNIIQTSEKDKDYFSK